MRGKGKGLCYNGRLLLSSVNVAHKRQKKMARKKGKEKEPGGTDKEQMDARFTYYTILLIG